jgi:hypothetical protein
LSTFNDQTEFIAAGSRNFETQLNRLNRQPMKRSPSSCISYSAPCFSLSEFRDLSRLKRCVYGNFIVKPAHTNNHLLAPYATQAVSVAITANPKFSRAFDRPADLLAQRRSFSSVFAGFFHTRRRKVKKVSFNPFF